jgi:hypothetical protein
MAALAGRAGLGALANQGSQFANCDTSVIRMTVVANEYEPAQVIAGAVGVIGSPSDNAWRPIARDDNSSGRFCYIAGGTENKPNCMTAAKRFVRGNNDVLHQFPKVSAAALRKYYHEFHGQGASSAQTVADRLVKRHRALQRGSHRTSQGENGIKHASFVDGQVNH